MLQYTYKKVSSLILILLITTVQFAQEKTGNIVEYFGKEKVEDIHEGTVRHIFKEGLILRIQTFCREQLLDKLYHRDESEEPSDGEPATSAEPAADSKD